MCRLRELLPYFDGYKSLRRSPCNNLQRLRRLTFHYFFTIVSLFSHGCSCFTARCGSRLCFCLLFLPFPASRHDGKQKQCRPDEAKGSPTGRAGGATSIKCTAVQTLASFCCTDIFTSFQSSTQRQYFFQSLR